MDKNFDNYLIPSESFLRDWQQRKFELIGGWKASIRNLKVGAHVPQFLLITVY